MGTNLSQVFIANTGNFSSSGDFTGITTNECGVWDFKGDTYRATRIFVKDVDIDEAAGADETASLVTVANPVWLYTDLQFVQNTAGNPIASPLINTRDIKRVRFDPYAASVGHTHVLTDAGSLTFTRDLRFKFIVRTTPTAQLNFYDAAGTDYVDISGEGKQFPLGAFNNTNHKAITVEVAGSEYTNFATLVDTLVERVEAHGILDDLVNITDNSTNATIVCRFAGVRVDLVITDADGNDMIGSSGDTIANAITESTLGVGNDWQVLSEEIRCRSRYGNFNRMYLPQNMPTYTVSGNAYHKVTIEYAHNWPTSSGIAPAGTLNQVVFYVGDSSTAMVAGDTNIETIFELGTDLTVAQEFVW